MDFYNSDQQFEFVSITHEPDGDESVELMDGVNNSFAVMNESDNEFADRIERIESRMNHFQNQNEKRFSSQEKSLAEMSAMRAKGNNRN